MTAREEVERLLAEHYSPDLCVRSGHFPRTAPLVAAHAWHLAQVLDEAGLLADEEPAEAVFVALPRATCPGCGEVKFIGHGPLCSDCFAEATP